MSLRIFDHNEIMQMEKIFRINLINTSSGIRSANLIGSINDKANSNLAIFNSIIHIGANPPSLGFISRPTSVQRHTYNNIKQTKFFTINQVHRNIIDQAHQTSAKYKTHESEFEACNLSEEYINDFPAPFVKESKIKIGLSFIDEHEIKINQTLLIIGKIEKLIISEEAILPDGCIDHENLESTTVSGLNSYFKNTFEKKLKFARPNKAGI